MHVLENAKILAKSSFLLLTKTYQSGINRNSRIPSISEAFRRILIETLATITNAGIGLQKFNKKQGETDWQEWSNEVDGAELPIPPGYRGEYPEDYGPAWEKWRKKRNFSKSFEIYIK